MGTLEKLTGREKEVLFYLCKGFLNKEISIQLNISEDTVKKHNKNIFKKIGVRNRAEAIILCSTSDQSFI
ncbi:response regulator transcription factor [Sediminibacterium sp.]|uniref:response regulator transcription factor n=1 Tax=Sediminibacterium sp. TaxID=1917865 RepID=UPI003F70251E